MALDHIIGTISFLVFLPSLILISMEAVVLWLLI